MSADLITDTEGEALTQVTVTVRSRREDASWSHDDLKALTRQVRARFDRLDIDLPPVAIRALPVEADAGAEDDVESVFAQRPR
ncbi:MAG: hypothetical protein MSC31_03530 [Solirubrobacteraceae bacterium MAG38_C4-C5]|nr:hypothetical protein [Candidatus Siliceabacter maunaloa]